MAGAGFPTYFKTATIGTLTVTGAATFASTVTVTTSVGIGTTIFLYEDAPNVLAQRNGGTGAAPVYQESRLYSYADGANTVYLSTRQLAGQTVISTSFAGTGVTTALQIGTEGASPLYLRSSGVARWAIEASGHFTAYADNAYDIGASGATRPRTLYLGTGIKTPVLEATATTLGFHGVTAITRAVLATGAGATVDNVITALQNIGLVSQS